MYSAFLTPTFANLKQAVCQGGCTKPMHWYNLCCYLPDKENQKETSVCVLRGLDPCVQ